jgi:hypothetical protein
VCAFCVEPCVYSAKKVKVETPPRLADSARAVKIIQEKPAKRTKHLKYTMQGIYFTNNSGRNEQKLIKAYMFAADSTLNPCSSLPCGLFTKHGN